MPLNSSTEHEAREEVLDRRCMWPWLIAYFQMFQGDWIHSADDDQPDQRDRDEDLPAQAHDLVVAEAREGRAHPEEHRDDRRRSWRTARTSPEPQLNASAATSNGGSQPPRNMIDGQRRDQDHVGVLGQEEHRERHARVLDHVAGDDLRLAFDHVERVAVGLGEARDEVDDEDRQQRQPVPATGS